MNPRSFLKQYDTLLERFGSQREVARKTGIPRTTIQDWLERREEILFTERPRPKPIEIKSPRSSVKRFIFTAAQSESSVHEKFLANLKAYADFLGAELHIAGFTYDKRLYEENRKDVKHAFYPSSILPYMTNQRFNIGENLTFCGEMNTLPTAQTPLAGFEVYTQGRDGIFPHAKVQLVSIPTMKEDPAKIIMTTGAVTKRNYIQRRAGILAEFHHIIGAVIVELDSSGDHFCRHLIAEEDSINPTKDTGNFQDLDYYVADGKVTKGHSVLAINWGDVHTESYDEDIAMLSWGVGFSLDGTPFVAHQDSMLDQLRPKHQFIHDAWDFKRRNHHNIDDPHFRYEMWVNGEESVEETCGNVGLFLKAIDRPSCHTVVVESNHDVAVKKWLKKADWRDDPVNAEFFLEANLAILRGLKRYENISVLEWCLKADIPDVTWVREDKGYKIADDKIECGCHGHLGANGAAGHPRAFTKMGSRANTGHTHSAGIMDGIYTAGAACSLDLGYNNGLSSWSHSDIITYANGKRTIVTKRNGKYRAS